MIGIIIILLLYLVVLELSKNTLLGWVIAIFVTVFYLARRSREKQKTAEKTSKGRSRRFLVFVLWLVILGINYMLTQPPARLTPAVDNRNPDVTDVLTVSQGQLTGVYNQDHSVRVYAGIPYAAPPVGDLRWKEPQPAQNWEGVRACDTFGPMAMQLRDSVIYSSLTDILALHRFRVSLKDNYREAMSEDCLYLNVFAPEEAGEEPLPVLFFIHGGSLMTGQSSRIDYRGEDLAKQGIIVVNFAYRLGAFGYYANEELAAESPDGTTGNYGLLDQIAALQWVRENIAAFGGDPEKITIAGESAGASSVNALCVSPLTEGMFVRAIAESSGIVAKHPYHTFRQMEDALEMGHAMMTEMGADNARQMRAIPAEKLVKTQYQNSAMTLDGYAITKMPYMSYLTGENHEQALLNGFNAKEADIFMLDTKATKENYTDLLKDIFGDYASEAAALVPPGEVVRDQKIIIDKGGEAKGSLNHLYSAAWFNYSHEVWSRFMAAQGRPVYEYYFTKRNNSVSNYHSGEMVYAYGNLWRYPGVYNSSDEELSKTIQAYWVNFVKTGDPNGEGLPVWEMRDTNKQQLIELGDQVKMIDDPYSEIYDILDKYQSGQ